MKLRLFVFVLVLLLSAVMATAALADDPRPDTTPAPPPGSCVALGTCPYATITPMSPEGTPPPPPDAFRLQAPGYEPAGTANVESSGLCVRCRLTGSKG